MQFRSGNGVHHHLMIVTRNAKLRSIECTGWRGQGVDPSGFYVDAQQIVVLVESSPTLGIKFDSAGKEFQYFKDDVNRHKDSCKIQSQIH